LVVQGFIPDQQAKKLASFIMGFLRIRVFMCESIVENFKLWVPLIPSTSAGDLRGRELPIVPYVRSDCLSRPLFRGWVVLVQHPKSVVENLRTGLFSNPLGSPVNRKFHEHDALR
jgi:hypothetical protein